jgi:hypothetical protein
MRLTLYPVAHVCDRYTERHGSNRLKAFKFHLALYLSEGVVDPEDLIEASKDGNDAQFQIEFPDDREYEAYEARIKQAQKMVYRAIGITPNRKQLAGMIMNWALRRKEADNV